jgi:short-subunit dehydrogenase
VKLAKEHGANIVAVARRESRLLELKQELEAGGTTKVETVVADLSRLEDVDRVFSHATGDRGLYAAVLNAGVTHFGDHGDLAWEEFETMLATNVTSVVRLTTRLLPYLETSGEGGGIMLVSSMAGLTPVPYQTAYSATKAFLVNFGAGLWHELRGKNVSITTFVPGGIETEMTAGESFKKLGGWLMSADRCADAAVDAFASRAYVHVPGLIYRVGATLVRVLPQRFVTGRVAAQYRHALAAASPASKV